ncbi:MAG: hypothetical protein J6X55_07145 [Victivallales bacterium]|nr:hypothetical protein [Victivallales bacterium]
MKHIKTLFILSLLAGITSLAQKMIIPEAPDGQVLADILDSPRAVVWDRAAVLHGFFKLGDGDKPATTDTQIRVFHHAGTLYYAAWCPCPTPPVCNNKGRDSSAWADESVALFIRVDEGGAAPTFCQLCVNCVGELYDEKGKDASAWNAPSFNAKAHRFNSGYVIIGQIAMADLGITGPLHGKTVCLNFGRLRKDKDGREYTTFSMLGDNSIRSYGQPDKFPSFCFGKDSEGQKADYSFSEYKNYCIDGDFELGKSARWTGLHGSNTSKWHQYSGYNGFYLGTEDVGVTCKAFHKIALPTVGTRCQLSFTSRFGTIEAPNWKPVRIHFLNANDNELGIWDGPGIGNLGGGMGNKSFDIFSDVFTVPKDAVAAYVEMHVIGPGSLYIDNVCVRKFTEIAYKPTAVSPADGAVLHDPTVAFQWKLFKNKDMQAGTMTIQVSTTPDFLGQASSMMPAAECIEFPECPPAGPWTETLPHDGKWFWRIKFDGQYGGTWSETSSFTLSVTPENETIPPTIGPMSPRARLNQRPATVIMPINDGAISSGIAEVKLFINRKDCTSDASFQDGKLTFSLPNDGKDFYEIECRATDKNGNKNVEYDFISTRPGKNIGKLDAQNFITIDGKRIFPIADYANMTESAFTSFDVMGFNCNLSPWMTPETPRIYPFLAAATRAGIGHIVFFGPSGFHCKGIIPKGSRADKKITENQCKALKKMVGHPGVWGIYIGDESMDGGFKMSAYQDFYKAMKEAAPEFLICWLPTYGRTEKQIWSEAAKACDFFIWDNYAWHRQELHKFMSDFDNISAWSNHHPAINCMEAHSYAADWGKKVQRFPPYDILRFNAYAPIVCGSRGLAVYVQNIRRVDYGKVNAYADSNEPDYQKRLAKVIRSVMDIKDFLLEDDQKETPLTTLSGQSRTLVKKHNGNYLVIAVNPSSEPSVLAIKDGLSLLDMETNKTVSGQITLPKFGVFVGKYAVADEK